VDTSGSGGAESRFLQSGKGIFGGEGKKVKEERIGGARPIRRPAPGASVNVDDEGETRNSNIKGGARSGSAPRYFDHISSGVLIDNLQKLLERHRRAWQNKNAHKGGGRLMGRGGRGALSITDRSKSWSFHILITQFGLGLLWFPLSSKGKKNAK